MKLGVEPEFIAELCDRTGCGFLLDIPHAKVTSWYLKRNVLDYIAELPLARLMEIHLAGIRYAPGIGIWDSNTALGEEDYQILVFVLQQARPKIITLEYGGYPDFQYNPIHRKKVPCFRNRADELLEMIKRVSLIIREF